MIEAPGCHAAFVLRTGFSKVKSNRDVPTVANEEWVKRFLRLAGHWPKDTREPRGPEHMAKMKAARGPYSDPRDTYIMREIRWAFESSNGRPLSTGYLVEKVFGWQLRLNGKPKKSLSLPEHSPGTPKDGDPDWQSVDQRPVGVVAAGRANGFARSCAS